MIEHSLPIVRPRVVGHDGAARPLDDIIDTILSKRTSEQIAIKGPMGSGKKTAVRYLAEVLKRRTQYRVQLADHGQLLHLDGDDSGTPFRVTITCSLTLAATSRLGVTLARWGRDELLEYLLARHPSACASVMTRIQDDQHCDGLPVLWSIALDRLAADESLPGVGYALMTHFREITPESKVLTTLRSIAWNAVMNDHDTGEPHCNNLRVLLDATSWTMQARLMHSGRIQRLLACEYFVQQLRTSQGHKVLNLTLPKDMLDLVTFGLRTEPEILQYLRQIANPTSERSFHPMAMTLLVAVDPTWRPAEIMREANLLRATLNGVQWQGIDLTSANLHSACLRNADLSGATLSGGDCRNAELTGATLTSSHLSRIKLAFANLSQCKFQMADLHNAVIESSDLTDACFDDADLRDAQLGNAQGTGTSFRNANLYNAVLLGAHLIDCDFTGANLNLATFDGVDLTSCCLDRVRMERGSMVDAFLENVCWKSVVLSRSTLRRAIMTGSELHGADMQWCNLSNTKLADIDWENANLRFADLRGATFHMGSSRGGLVFSPIACEGSKTGFYTDEFNDQSFKAPEEIRKASLRGADLRGARLEGVDFYLVDLRGAKLDDDQFAIAKSSGAILSDPVVEG